VAEPRIVIPVVAGSIPVSHPTLSPSRETRSFPSMDSIEAKIGYRFANLALLSEALTHPSLSCETKRTQPDNQRLEYLGDAVIQLVLTEELFRRYPGESEGRLTKLRSRLVSREALCLFANRLELGSHLFLGKGELASGGRNRPSNLADAFEALAGAVYIDGGLEAARGFLFGNFGVLMDEILSQSEEMNPKGELQECLQAIAPASPTYRIVGQEGPDHLKSFVAEVRWEGIALGQGSGNSKKEAEINAATEALRERRWKEKQNREEVVKNSEEL
jgi:ribonuclease III